jgi:hypothetical protein
VAPCGAPDSDPVEPHATSSNYLLVFKSPRTALIIELRKHISQHCDTLELMADETVKVLQQQVAALQRQVADLQRNLVRESRNTTAHINKIYERIIDIHEYLWPLVRKVFPNYSKDLRAIVRLTKRRGPDIDEGKSL